MNENKMIYIFSLLLFVCGMTTVFLTPPLAVPDEDRHFLNAYAYSQGNFFLTSEPAAEEGGKYYPQFVLEFHDKYCNEFQGLLEQKYDFTEAYFSSWLEVQEGNREMVFRTGDIWGINNPWSFFFAAIGMKIGQPLFRLFGQNHDSAYNLLLMGRVFNFIAFFIIGMAAIKITPCLKRTMMFLLAMPMTLFLAASLSYDAIVISTTMLLFSELLKLIIGDNNVEKKDIGAMVWCSLFLLAIKPVYAPFFMLCFFISKDKFGEKKRYYKSIFYVILGGIAGYIIPTLADYITKSKVVLEKIEELEIQKQYFMGHFYLFPQFIFNSVKEYGSFYLTSFLGNLGELDTNYPIPILVLFLSVLFIVTIVDVLGVENLSWKFKIVNFLAICVALLGTFGYIYLTWTPLVLGTGGNIISGVQGRYFIPLYCFVAVLLGVNIKEKIPQKIQDGIEFGCNYLNTVTVVLMAISVPVIILLRFWI